MVFLAATACAVPEAVEVWLAPESPHDAYRSGLQAAGLDGTALATAWLAAADSALVASVGVPLPYREEGLLLPEAPEALGYEVELRRGEEVRIAATLAAGAPVHLFVDLFRVGSEAGRPPPRVDSDAESTGTLVYRVRRSGRYRIRIQPELLRGGRYQVSIEGTASLAFPVEGRDAGSILSFFGADRDAGRRVHHGVDIFAPRGTPVRAAASGRVTRVGDNRLGGRVVWIRDDDANESHYYAHLDEQLVEAGTQVEAGDLIGRVGNTGNAITTAPHLHFGIYARGEGAVDPLPYLDDRRPAPPDSRVSPESFRTVRRVAEGGGRIRRGPDTRFPIVTEVEEGAPIQIAAGTSDWFRVRLADGTTGFVFARRTEAIPDTGGRE